MDSSSPTISALYDAARKSDKLSCDEHVSVKTIPYSRINDDFCDCLDGSDEPGTSACTKGTFFCRNRGYHSAKIFKSRVNDLVCDCCDGSDEWQHPTLCPNTCAEAGASFRKEVADKAARYAAGNAARLGVLASVLQTKNGWKAEISTIQAQEAEKHKIVADLRARKEAAEKVEAEAEAARKLQDESAALRRAAEKMANEDMSADQYLKWCEEGGEERKQHCLAEAEAAAEEKQEQGGGATGAATPPPADATTETTAAVAQETEQREETEAERGQRIARQWTRSSEAAGDADAAAAAVEDEGDKLLRENGELDENAPAGEQQKESVRLNTELTTAERDVQSLHDKKEQLNKKLEYNYGEDDALVSMVGRCVESDAQTKGGASYKYRVCPFDRSEQDSLSLGKFAEVSYAEDGASATMKFTGGAKCWNGPERSMTATLVCGSTDRMTSVDEPSVCEYTSVVETPMMCTNSLVARAKEEHDELEKSAKPEHSDELK